ncbi:germ line transcription factor 1 isoform X2 [Rhodnius prolixus]|uniref:germ line transcription factor 1 isoform X2 n=1 Tax=Rhodnius prolixus TaxID=13249 RepID=UPI003D18AB68
MPKDIRSYFLTTSKNKKIEKTNNEEIEPNRKRKKHNIVLSDSDDEPVVKSPRTEKKVVHSRKEEETSTYFEVSKETVHKHFGETPVKRKKSAHKVDEDTARLGDITDLVQDVDDDNDWVTSCIDKYPKSEGDSSEVNPHAEDGVDAKKRKLNNSIDSEKSKINRSTINFKNLDSVASISAKNSESGQNFRKSEKNVSPTKVGSPQKTLTSYLSPKKKTPPRINKLDVTRSSIHPPKVDGLKVTKISEQSKTKNRQKELEGISSVKTDSSFALHAISPENSDDELKKNYISPTKNKICLKRSPAITSVNEDLKSADHLLSPENSDSEEESKISSVSKQISSKCSNNDTSTKKPKDNFSKTVGEPVVQCNVKSDNKIKNSESPKFNVVKSELKFELWADKYRPVNLKQLIGQQGEKSNVNKLLKWLKSWFDNRSGKKKISRPSPWAKDDSGAYFKAALLSGPPGIGKTSTAHLVCKELNMDVVEFNASDTRSKKLLNQEIAELLSSKSLSPFMQGGNSTSRNHVLLMDEVDGMAGNEDRGGIQELIALIKNTKIPIICLCNDRNHPKIRSLVNYCFDLRFNRPRVEQIKGAMYSICYKENLKIKPEQLVEIISSTNQDIRLVLNHLSMLAAKKEENMNFKNKEIKLGAWDVARKVFSHEEHKFMTIHDKCDLFFHDYSIAPLFIHENYLNVIPYSEKGKTKQGKIELFAKAANSLCHGDLIDQVLRAQSAWSLLPAQAVFSSLIPGDILSGRVGGMINFPAWFGKNSKKNKFDRLCQEIQMHTRLRVSASKEAICTDYSYRLRDGIVSSLITSGTEGVESSLQFLHEYNLLREDIESLTELTTWPHTKDPFSTLDSKVKAAFTRAYNKRPVLTPFSINALAKKGRKGGSEVNELEMASNEEAVEDNGDQSDQGEDLAADGMIIVKQKDKKELNKKATAKKESASSSKPRGGKRGGKN